MAYSNNINVGINVPVGKSGHFFSFFEKDEPFNQDKTFS